MEAIGYDAMAVGNHEFDDGPEGLAKFIDAVSFPVVSGNLDLSQEPILKNHVKDSVIIDIGGQKIGIVSALATDTVDTSSPGDNVKFMDEIAALRKTLQKWKQMASIKLLRLLTWVFRWILK